jgi:polyhydroxyalkanoate synthesis regulator phasin
VALVTSGIAELTRHRAEQIVKDFVKTGDVRKDQTSGVIKELLKRSAENRKELAGFVRAEIRNQMESLGVASKRDFERLERRVVRLEERGKTTKPSPAPAAKPTPAKTSKAASSNRPKVKAPKAPRKAASDDTSKG